MGLKLSISAIFFGFHKISLLKNLISRELQRIIENFHFSISVSKHFDFTFHFSKKSESICFSLCTSRKRVKAFFFHFALLEKEWKLFFFTFHFSNFKNPLSLVPASCNISLACYNFAHVLWHISIIYICESASSLVLLAYNGSLLVIPKLIFPRSLGLGIALPELSYSLRKPRLNLDKHVDTMI